jgi:transcriptional regulator with XRE-family HTH domain
MLPGVTDHDDRWAAVGEAVRARREELGLTQVELARASGVSEPTIRVLERPRGPRRYRHGTLRDLARALRWPDDAVARIRAGRPPAEDLVEPSRGSVEDRLAALEAELMRLREQLAAERQRT